MNLRRNDLSRFSLVVQLAILIGISMLLLAKPDDTLAQPGQFIEIAWHPTDEIIALSDGYTLSLYSTSFARIAETDLLSPTQRYTVWVHRIRWSPDGTKIAVSIVADNIDPSGRMLQIWDWNGSNLQKIADIPGMNVSFGDAVAWHPDSSRLAAIELNQIPGQTIVGINIYSDTNGTLLATIGESAILQIDQVEWSTDGSQIAVSTGGSLQIWDATTESLVGTLTNRFNPEAELEYSPTGSSLALTSLDAPNDIQIWDTNSFQLSQILSGHTSLVGSFTWGGGGIISIGFDDTTRVWDVATGQAIMTIQSGITGKPSWNPAGTQFVVFNNLLGVVQIIDVATGDVLETFDPFAVATCDPVFTIPDGDTPALITAIEAANGTPEPDTICLPDSAQLTPSPLPTSP